MRFNFFKWRIFITAIKKKDLTFYDTCWNCGGHRFKYKKKVNGRQKVICLDCGKAGYKFL